MHDRPLVHRDDGFRGGWFPTQGAARSDGAVVAAPLLDDDLCHLQAAENLAVEKFISESFDAAIPKAVIEDENTVHWFFNRGSEPATTLVCDIVPASW